MWLNENTDVNNHARIVVIFVYAFDGIIKEELVVLLSLPERILDIHNAVRKTFF
jgi:hypothetical protein